MKKLFTLLMFAGSIGIASAQKAGSKDIKKDYSKDFGFNQSDRDFGKKDKAGSYGDSYKSLKEKQRQIALINRDFDQKVNKVKMDRRLRQSEKTKQIKMLERQRSIELKQIEQKFSNGHYASNSKW